MNPHANESTKTHLDDATQRLLLRIFAVGSMTFFLAAASQIAIPIDPLGIPISLQTYAVVVTALTLGPRLGVLSILLYIITGAVGVRVFADNTGGWITLIGQSGGYILGFLICQPFVAMIVRRRNKEITQPDGTTRRIPGTVRGFGAILLAAIVAHAIVFAIGVPWLYMIHLLDSETDPLSWGSAIYFGLVVFLPGMVLKSALAAITGMLLVPACAERIW